jgi:phospholipid/cholesterol/gamma-HCH transport system substrate-binding protein
MEFNARYALISVFALAVLAMLFGFVFWLNGFGGFGPRSEYQVRFSVPVSGLTNGSNVLFNGLKVGEVTGLGLDKNNPGEFSAIISVDPNTPMRQDTIAGVDYQGLTGAANISLTGGAVDSPELVSIDGRLPQIIAKPENSRSWTTNAARVLSKLDEMLSGENNRFDTILAGLERMLGGDQEKEAGLYDLLAPSSFQLDTADVEWQLVVSEPTVVLSLNTDKILELKSDAVWKPFDKARWTDNLPNLMQSKLVQGFENAGLGKQILRSADAFDPENKLSIDIRLFHYRSFGEPAVVGDIVAKIVGNDGSVTDAKRFQMELPIATKTDADIANKMNELFSIMSSEIINWSAATL